MYYYFFIHIFIILGSTKIEMSTESGTSNAWIDLQQLQNNKYSMKHDPSQRLVCTSIHISNIEN